MKGFAYHERDKRQLLDTLAIAYSRARRNCRDPHARYLGGALRSASAFLWNTGGAKNVAGSIRASQLSLLAVQSLKLSNGTNAYLNDARLAANSAIANELSDNDPRNDDVRPLGDLAEIFWHRGDDKHGRAAVAVLAVVECLLMHDAPAFPVWPMTRSRQRLASEIGDQA